MTKNIRDPKEYKTFNMRLPIETWRFLKIEAARQDVHMTHLIFEAVDKFKKKMEKKDLISYDANV